jgi:MerR family redox-sensitive transcriptional activator SoxR
VLRRVAFIRIAQRMGLSLDRVATALETLPPDRAPTKAQWATLSRSWRRELDDRIALLESLRDDLTSCIGCGCLSLQTCKLYNPDDVAATRGESARYLLGDDPEEVVPGLSL